MLLLSHKATYTDYTRLSTRFHANGHTYIIMTTICRCFVIFSYIFNGILMVRTSLMTANVVVIISLFTTSSFEPMNNRGLPFALAGTMFVYCLLISIISSIRWEKKTKLFIKNSIIYWTIFRFFSEIFQFYYQCVCPDSRQKSTNFSTNYYYLWQLVERYYIFFVYLRVCVITDAGRFLFVIV